MYETYTCPSWETEWVPKRKSSYECEHCGVELKDHEVFIRSGKAYCGCCK